MALAASLAEEAKPKVEVSEKKGNGEVTRTVSKDYTSVGVSAVAKEAGIGVLVDGDGLPVDRYCFAECRFE